MKNISLHTSLISDASSIEIVRRITRVCNASIEYSNHIACKFKTNEKFLVRDTKNIPLVKIVLVI